MPEDASTPLMNSGQDHGHSHGNSHGNHGHSHGAPQAKAHAKGGHGHAHDAPKGGNDQGGHGHSHGAPQANKHAHGSEEDHGHSHGAAKTEPGHAHGGGDDHGHAHGDHEEAKNPNEARNKLIKATLLCFCFMIAELVGGYLAHSLAIMTDAAHLLSDMAGFAISIVAISLAKKEATMQYSFGFHRAEILGALASIMLIWALTAVLVFESIQRLMKPEELKVEGRLMFIISSLGILVNGAMMCVLGGHGHSHGGAEHAEGEDGEEQENINVEAAWVHVVGDLVQGIGVMIAAALIWWGPGMHLCEEHDPDCGGWTVVVTEDNGIVPTITNYTHHGHPTVEWSGQDKDTFKSGINWYLADPVCTLLFSCLVMFTTVGIVKTSINVLMARAPPEINMEALNKQLRSIPGAKDVHDLHCWQISQGKNAMSCHIQIESLDEYSRVFDAAKAITTQKGLHGCIQLDVGACDAHDHWRGAAPAGGHGHAH